MRSFPVHTVCRWIGHEIRVVENHYLQISADDMKRAVGEDEKEAVQNPVQQTAAGDRTESREVDSTAVSDVARRGAKGKVGVAGLEPATSSL